MTTDELWAKFEDLARGYGLDAKRNYDGEYVNLEVMFSWIAYHAAHASRDAEVEALRKDAERYRWLVENCSSNGGLGVEIFIGNDAPDAIDLAAAIDAAMREEK